MGIHDAIPLLVLARLICVCDDEVEPDVCERDVIALLDELTAKGLVQTIDAARSS